MSTATANGSRDMPCAAANKRAGIVLAGGRNRAFWPWKPGTTLLDQAERILQRSGVERILVSGPQARADAIPDAIGQGGPLAGLQSVLDHLELEEGTTLIVIPADMPLLSPHALARLADIAECDGRGALFDLGPLPLALILTPSLPAAVSGTLSGKGSLTALVARLKLPVIASLPGDGLDNIGSRKELNALRQRMDTRWATA